MRENPDGSYFLQGFYGCGKTYLLMAQYCSMALAGKHCVLRSAKDLKDELLPRARDCAPRPRAGGQPRA
jgi:hypothetical protein